MSAPLLVVAAWLAGATFGLASRPERPENARVALWAAGLFGAGAVAPAGASLFLLFPDWSLMYAAHPEHGWPALTLGLLVAGYVGAPVLGCLAARALTAHEGPRAGFGLVGVSLALLLLGAGMGWERLTHVAHYEAFHYGGARLTLARSALFVPVVLSGAALAGVYVFSVLHLRRQV
jgi:hypothetical protein